MKALPIPLEFELWVIPRLKVPGNIYALQWDKLYLPVEEKPVERYFAVDSDCTWQCDWSETNEDRGNFETKMAHLSQKKALKHRALLIKVNLNAVRSVFGGECVMAGSKFPAPVEGVIELNSEIWCTGLATPSRKIVWTNTLQQQLLRAYGLLHLKQDECEMHRQCWVEANLRGIASVVPQ